MFLAMRDLFAMSAAGFRDHRAKRALAIALFLGVYFVDIVVYFMSKNLTAATSCSALPSLVVDATKICAVWTQFAIALQTLATT